MSPRAFARVLALAGLEPSGRVGLLADLELARALGASPLGVATALTAQGRRTFALGACPARLVQRQIQALLELGPIDAVKVGMVSERKVLQAIGRALGQVRAVRVVDPVVRSSRGERLSWLTAGDYLRLAGPEVVLTPNLNEARWLLGWRRAVENPAQAAEAGSCLLERGFRAVVVKGGHARAAAVDVVCTREGVVFLEGSRLPARATRRGTGCRYSTALAVGLAMGESVLEAAKGAKAVVRAYLHPL